MSNVGTTLGNKPAHSSLLLAALVTIGMASATVQANHNPEIYGQPADLGGAANASQNDTDPGGNGNFATVYDDFTFRDGATVTDVHWVGAYFNEGTEPRPPITNFRIEFYSDSVGQPGGSLGFQDFAGDAGETSHPGCAFDPCYDYWVDLTSPFAAAAGTRYWLSIVPDIGIPPQWGWQEGTGGNGIAYQKFFGTLNELDVDLAFSLTGLPPDTGGVPEPATLALLGLGLAGLGLSRRRKQS